MYDSTFKKIKHPKSKKNLETSEICEQNMFFALDPYVEAAHEKTHKTPT
jgi:hypothetical protein